MIKLRLVFILSGIALCFHSIATYAQSYSEAALLFSRTKPGGSARIQAMGGSQIALGGDYSSAFSNPAGLGMFNRSEFTFSPGLGSYTTKSVFIDDGSTHNESLSRIIVPGMGIVFNLPANRESSFIGGSFSVTFNRTNDFNRSIRYGGFNPENSILYFFIDDAYGETSSQFHPGGRHFNTPTGLSYHNFLINPRSEDEPPGSPIEYFTDVIDVPDQEEEIETKGSMNQWSLSYGANFLDKFFIGGGIGISTLRYKQKKIFTEYFPEDPLLRTLDLEENTEIKGTGINATIGAIVRPLEYIQIGVSYSTPTYFYLSESYEASLGTDWRFDSDAFASTDPLTSEYSLTLPSRVSAGIAFISKFGFITGDVELTNPSKSRYSADRFSFAFENDEIRTLYKPVVNYRVGAEYRYNILRVRGGYGVQADPYKSRFQVDNKITSVSGGVGVRLDKFYVDFALVHSWADKIGYRPYVLFDGSGPLVTLENITTMGMLTFGFTY